MLCSVPTHLLLTVSVGCTVLATAAEPSTTPKPATPVPGRVPAPNASRRLPVLTPSTSEAAAPVLPPMTTVLLLLPVPSVLLLPVVLLPVRRLARHVHLLLPGQPLTRNTSLLNRFSSCMAVSWKWL